MKYQLIRSARRKTIALQVKNAEVIIRAPEFVKTSYIDDLVRGKSLWIREKVSQQRQDINNSLQAHASYFDGSKSINIDGLPHKVLICFGKQQVIHNTVDKLIYVYIPEKYQHYPLTSDLITAKAKCLIEKWFNAEVTEYLRSRLATLSIKTSLYPSSNKVRKYKSRWGSCNSRGELSFNSLLKMLPLWVVDYVIVHELCHLKYMNHSTKFWQLVEKYEPNFRQAKKWLRENQHALIWD